MRWADDEIQKLKSLYGTVKIDNICNVLNKSSQAIRNKACTLGLKSNRSIARARFTFDRNYFSSITPYRAYWAGFIAADGYITKDNRVSISLARKDRCILEAFKNDIQYTGNIYDVDSLRVYSRLEIHSKEFCSNLFLNYGITNNKSFSLQPPILPNDCVLSFIIGMIDGDGWIYRVKQGYLRLGLISTYEVIEWAKQHLDSLLGHSTTRIYKSGKYLYRLEYSGKQAEKVKELLLKENTPYKLPRKWYGT